MMVAHASSCAWNQSTMAKECPLLLHSQLWKQDFELDDAHELANQI